MNVWRYYIFRGSRSFLKKMSFGHHSLIVARKGPITRLCDRFACAQVGFQRHQKAAGMRACVLALECPVVTSRQMVQSRTNQFILICQSFKKHTQI